MFTSTSSKPTNSHLCYGKIHHSDTKGKGKELNEFDEMKVQLQQLKNQFELEKFNRIELESQVNGLKSLVKDLITEPKVKNSMLLESANSQDLDTFKILVDHNIDDHILIDIFKIAIKKNHLDVVKYLVENDKCEIYNINAAFKESCKFGNVEMAKFLDDSGANTECPFNSPLFMAVRSGSLEMVKYLVEKGADIKMQNTLAKNDFLSIASANGNLEIVKYLVENGIKINEKAIEAAIKNKNYAVVHYLTSDY